MKVLSYAAALMMVLTVVEPVRVQAAVMQFTVSREHLSYVAFDDPQVTNVLTNLTADEFRAQTDRLRPSLVGLRELSTRITTIEDYLAWVHEITAPFTGADDQPGELTADPLETFGDGLNPGQGYTVSFLFSRFAPRQPPGTYYQIPKGTDRYTGDPTTDHLLVVDFVASADFRTTPVLLIEEPSDIPSSFGLAGFSIAATSIPEPASLALLGLGIGGCAVFRRRAA